MACGTVVRVAMTKVTDIFIAPLGNTLGHLRHYVLSHKVIYALPKPIRIELRRYQSAFSDGYDPGL